MVNRLEERMLERLREYHNSALASESRKDMEEHRKCKVKVDPLILSEKDDIKDFTY